jgi:cytochrome P450
MVPGPRSNILLGSLVELQRDRLGFLRNMALRHGAVVRYRIAHLTIYQVNHPDGVLRILQTNSHNYSKEVSGFKALKLVLGNGLITSEGEYWRSQRRVIQPIFHHHHMEISGDLIALAVLEMMDHWQENLLNDQILDMATELRRLTINIIATFLFGSELGNDREALVNAVSTLAENLFRFAQPFHPPLAIPTSHNRKIASALANINAIVYKAINKERRQGTHNRSLLSIMVSARNEKTGEGMNDTQLRDEIVSLFSAGSGTTANTLIWAIYFLSQYPEIAYRLRFELEQVLGERRPTVADLPNLSYTRHIIEETLRFYPPVWVTARRVVAQDEICGFDIPARAVVVVSPYVMHHDPVYWSNSERFDPDRFMPEQTRGRPHYVYFPFGGGPHLCLGKALAMMETQLVLATITQCYRFELIPDYSMQLQTLGGLRPQHGLPMAVYSL